MNDNNWAVYIHTNKKNLKMYVGITSRKPEVRWNSGRGYVGNDYFMKAIEKYGWDGFYHDIIETGLSREEAGEMEIFLIKTLHTTNRDCGYNISNGGFSCDRITEETRLKMSESAKHRPPISDARRKWLSDRLKGNQLAKGNHLSKERIEQLAEISRNRVRTKEERDKISKGVSKAVVQIDSSCNVVNTFSSATEAYKATGIGLTGISQACNKKRNGSGGYIWMWKKDYDEYDGDFSEFIIVSWGSSLKHELKNKEVKN